MPVERVIISENLPNNLWGNLWSYLKEQRYMITAGCKVDSFGLHKAHSYSVLNIHSFFGNSDRAILLFNPWGDQKLYGKFEINHRNYLIRLEEKQKNGLFWLSFRDFLCSFTYLDICKFDPKWSAKRFRFKIPFNLSDQSNFTIFKLQTSKRMEFNFTIYQKINRDLERKFLLSLSLLIYRLNDKNSKTIELVFNSAIFTEKIKNIISTLEKGKYFLLILSFNHWGITSRCKNRQI